MRMTDAELKRLSQYRGADLSTLEPWERERAIIYRSIVATLERLDRLDSLLDLTTDLDERALIAMEQKKTADELAVEAVKLEVITTLSQG